MDITNSDNKIILIEDICKLIGDSRRRIAINVNSELCLLNWHVGNRIKEDILHNQRAKYGKEILSSLSAVLTKKFGIGWGVQKLKHCVRAAYIFSKDEIVYAVSTQLTWTHLRALMGIKDELARRFYMEMTRIENWDTRTLIKKIDAQLYQRTVLSRRPEDVIKNELAKVHETGTIVPDMVFRSSYFLDLLGLPDIFSESDLEEAIITQIQYFIKELGNDFAFLDRQHRISVDGVDYHLDLLFYHRGLRRLVAIDLKLGKFRPEHEGQMMLYLRYLDHNERKEGEESPIGLILCSEGNTEHIEYFMLDVDSPIKVAQYYTKLPDKATLSRKLQRAIAVAKEHINEKASS